jgi:hypothetical protein
MATHILGALNIIDNTKPIPLAAAGPGDLIMTKHSNSLGHTRVIYSIREVQTGFWFWKQTKTQVTWYQGNLPPVVPQRKEMSWDALLSGGNIYGNSSRRWRFMW